MEVRGSRYAGDGSNLDCSSALRSGNSYGSAKSAWCREHSVFPTELEKWRINAVQALATPEDPRATPQQTRHDHRRIKELERELRRKDRALAETAALLVLSKKLSAIYGEGADE